MASREPVKTWFSWFLDWVKDFIRKSKNSDERKLLTLELLKSRDSFAMAESVQRNTPGAVSTWYITHKNHPSSRLVITLDNLAEVKEFLKELLPSDTGALNVTRTHLISIQWLIVVGEKQKQVYKFKGAWLADLQGNSSSINAKASEVVRYLVKGLLDLQTVASLNWENRVDKLNWEEEITYKCKIISEKHKPHLKRIRKPELIEDATSKKNKG